jgi:hypothetical protein
MADVNEMFDSNTREDSFFVPGDKPKKKDREFKPRAKGEYFGHIIECESKVVDVKGGEHKARLYTYTFQASEHNAGVKYTIPGIDGNPEEVDGKEYKGYKFKGKLWRFLEPGKDDTFKSKSDANGTFLRFCEVVGVKCPVEKRNIDGQDVEVQLLPTLSPEDILGKPCIAFVDLGREFVDKNGNKRRFHDVKWVNKWPNGEVKVISNSGAEDEIPF